MPFHEIAYAPDEHVLVTLDGKELLAHDAQSEAPKWRLTFEHSLVAALFAETGSLASEGGGSPWRSSSSGRCVVAVDAEGGVHAIDPLLGEKMGSLGPFGKPAAVASGTGGVFALAVADNVHLWRSRERTEIAARATAIAFSNDGATLAIGGADGGVRFMSVGGAKTPVETHCAVVHGGAIGDLVQHPGGAWIAAGKSGVSKITSTGAQRLDSIPVDVRRVRLDANGKRIAAQLSERGVAVYSWPHLEVELRVEYMERPVRGLAFGPNDWLGIGLDRGDGNKIDVATQATHRTDTHPGRTHNSWLLSVQGKATVLSAKEAEEVRRMKDPFHAPPPPPGPGIGGGGGGNGGRIGIGVAISVALLVLRLCAAGSRSSSYPTSSYPLPYTLPTVPTTAAAPKTVKHVALVRLEGPTLTATTEEIPAANFGEGEEPGTIWSAPDGTVFVTTLTSTHDGSNVHRRDTTGTWSVISRRRSSRPCQLWGKSAKDFYILDHDSIAHYDGTRTTEVLPPAPETFALGGIGEDIFISGLSQDRDTGDDRMQLHRRQGAAADAKWVVEPTPESLTVRALWSGGGTLWARGVAKDGEEGVDDRLLQRVSGRWTERKWFGAKRPAAAGIKALWVSPSGDAFMANYDGIYRSSNGGASWTKTSETSDAKALWGRSNNDVYAATLDGVDHYDGKKWSPTSYRSGDTAHVARVMGGTASEVLLVVPARDDDD